METQNKLEIHHVAKRLPYGLKAEMLNYKSDYVGQRYDTLVGVHQWDKNSQYWSALTIHGSKPNLQDIKLLLFPLSSLTETITIKGKEFIPIEWFEIGDEDNVSPESDFGNINLIKTLTMVSENGIYHDVKYFPQFVVEKLNEWHIDYENLIEKGLAISVFDLDKNPYK